MLRSREQLGLHRASEGDMSFMFEVYYRPPANPIREAQLTDRVAGFGGRLDYRECPKEAGRGICLTYEFDDRETATRAADALSKLGEHVEEPVDYGS